MKDTTVLGRSQPHDDLIPVSLSFSLSLSPLSVSPVSSPQSHGAICKPTQPQWNRSQPEEEHKVREAFYALCVCVCVCVCVCLGRGGGCTYQASGFASGEVIYVHARLEIRSLLQIHTERERERDRERERGRRKRKRERVKE